MPNHINLDEADSYPPQEIFTTDELRSIYAGVESDVADKTRDEEPMLRHIVGAHIGHIFRELDVIDEATRGINEITGSNDVPATHFAAPWAVGRVETRKEYPANGLMEHGTPFDELPEAEKDAALARQASRLIIDALNQRTQPLIEEREADK